MKAFVFFPLFVPVVAMTGFKKAEWCLLAMWAKHPWHGLDGRGLPDSPCLLAVDHPWCTLCNPGPQLSSPWWSCGTPSSAGCAAQSCLLGGPSCPCAMGCSGRCSWGWPGGIGVLACGCAAVLGLPAVIHLQFLKHGALLSFAAASQHGVSPQCGSELVSVEVLLSWMETKYCFLHKIPGVPRPVSFQTKKKNKRMIFFFLQEIIAFNKSLIPNTVAISQGVLISFPIF